VEKRRSDRWWRRSGFALGLAGVLALVLAAHVPAAPRGLGLDLTIAPAPTGKMLTLRPADQLLTVAGMQPGRVASAHTLLMNPTPDTRHVTMRVLASSHALDRALMVEATLDGRRLYRGPLGGLRTPTHPFDIESGDGPELRLRVWLPPDATGWRGHIEDLTLEFESTAD
jgi:hypothetical protein